MSQLSGVKQDKEQLSADSLQNQREQTEFQFSSRGRRTPGVHRGKITDRKFLFGSGVRGGGYHRRPPPQRHPESRSHPRPGKACDRRTGQPRRTHVRRWHLRWPIPRLLFKSSLFLIPSAGGVRLSGSAGQAADQAAVKIPSLSGPTSYPVHRSRKTARYLPWSTGPLW